MRPVCRPFNQARTLDEAKRNPGLFAETKGAAGVPRPIKRIYALCDKAMECRNGVSPLRAAHGRVLRDSAVHGRTSAAGAGIPAAA